LIYQTEPEVLVLEAGTYQVQLVPITKYESRKYVKSFFVPKGFSEEDVNRAMSKVRRDIEASYGWFQLLGFIPILIWRRLTGRLIPNPIRGGVVCSELVLNYLRALEPGSKWDTMDKDSVSPEDLFVELVAHHKFEWTN
jgi:hypothetical protein